MRLYNDIAIALALVVSGVKTSNVARRKAEAATNRFKTMISHR
jgi:hypothetical protein